MYHPETTPAKAGAATVTPHETFRYHHVEQQILAMIESGRFAAGDRLPSLRSLCSSMGVSLATVNHAYMELERKGIIEARPRSGYFVRKPGVPLPLPVTEQSTPEIGEENRTNLIQMVLEAVGNKNLISFGCVTPDPALLPGKALARIMQDVTRLSTYDSLSYEVIQGNPELRRQIAWRGQELGLAVQSEDVLITVGTMEALHITLRALTHPGDSVVIQSPTYFCLVQLLENLGLRAIEVPSSPEHGISPAALHEAITKFDVAACILSPNFNNPDGSLMPDEAKREIVDMLARRGVPLVEDDVAGDVHFGPSRPTPLKSFDRKDNVTLCSSFSKTIAPGYRCGWMLPGKIMRKALEIKATTNVCCASPTQMVVAEFLRQGLYERHLKRLRVATERQMQTIQHHLATYFPEGTGVTRPKGGGFLWVSLPEKVDSVQLFKEAKSQGILISPGPIFTTRDQFRNYIRLSCCGVWHERMEHGLKVLGTLAGELA